MQLTAQVEFIASFLLVIHDYLYFLNFAVEALLLNNSASFMNSWFSTSKQTVIFVLTIVGTSHLIKYMDIQM
jgi:hypothetical protein